MSVKNIISVLEQASEREYFEGLRWYNVASENAELLHRDKSVASAIIAAVSPGLRWERNIETARRIIDDEPLDGLGVRWYDGVRKAYHILAGEAPLDVLGGNKVRAFYECILDPFNAYHVCVDGHAIAIASGERITLDKVDKLSTKAYNAIARQYRQAAKRVGILPLQLQAITWVTWRRLHVAPIK